MTNKATMYGLMTIAAVLLIAMAFAGAVSAAGPYTAAQWNALTDAQVNDLTGTVYITDSDINAVIYPKFNGSTGFTPADNLTLDFAGYKGTFSGDTNVSTNGLGALFGYVNLNGVSEKRTLTIKNINMTSVVVNASSGSYVGGIVGNFVGKSIDLSILNFTNCHLVNCSITAGNSRVGGLVGYASSASVNVWDCNAKHCDVVSGSEMVGGLVGCAHSASFWRCNVMNSTIASTSYDLREAGGLIGDSNSASFEECGVENTSIYGGRSQIGGLIGLADNASYTTLSFMNGCTVKNCVLASRAGDVGGLVGHATPTINPRITNNCHVLNCTIVSDSDYVGGLVGYAGSASITGSGNSVEYSAVLGQSPTDLVNGSLDGGFIGCTVNLNTNFIHNSSSVPYNDDIKLYNVTGNQITSLSDSTARFTFWKTIFNTTGYNASKFSGNIQQVTYLGTYGEVGGYGVGSAPTLIYDANGATGTVPASKLYGTGSTVTVADQGDLVKAGLVFSGWNTADDGSGTTYQPGATFTITTDTTLYAKWTLPTYVEVNTWAGLNKSIAEWTDTEIARTVAVNASIEDRTQPGLGEYDGIKVRGKIILTTNASPAGDEAVINGKGFARFFEIGAGGDLTICGNGTSSTLNLTGGKNTSSAFYQEGGAILVRNGNLTINDGVKITNCSAVDGGAVYICDDLTFTMNGGSITDCTADYEGGAVKFHEGTFIMNGGCITECNAKYGGGVEIDTGVFTMNNGTIANCTADVYGGGVELDVGVFTMNNGTIANCTADEYGGGVEIYIGVFTMNNGTIIRCSSDYGGGIDQDSTFTMNGGYITECTANYGGGIYINREATISGGVIEGNNAYVAGSGIFCDEETIVINGTVVVAENNDVALVYDDSDYYPIEMGDTTAESFTGHIDNITIYYTDYEEYEEKPSGYVGQSIVVGGSAFSNAFKLRASSVYSSYQLTTSGNDLILSKKSTPYTPSSSSKHSGSTVILSEGQTAPTAYATAAPTVAPTVKPTEKPATPTVIATAAPTTQPTETQKSPAPVIGIIAGLGAAAVLLRLRK